MKLNKLIQALALAGLSTQVFAQDAAQQDAATDPNAKVERIRVTGSSIKRTTIEGDLPITVFSRADINAAGITSAEQLLLQAQSVLPITWRTIDIALDQNLVTKYGASIPVLTNEEGQGLHWPFSLLDIYQLQIKQ